MKKHIFLHLLTFFTLSLSHSLIGQTIVDPNTFPAKTSADGTEAIYTREDAVNRKVLLSVAKKYLTPNVQTTLIAYTPSATGNSTNLMEFVKHSTTGEVWYIDSAGDAFKLFDPPATMNSFSVVQDTIWVFYDINGTEIDRDTFPVSTYSAAASQLTDLTDVGSATATAGRLLIADGTDWESVALSGDVTVNSSGVTTIGPDAVGTTEIADNTVTLAKEAGGTANRLKGFDASGDPSEIAVAGSATISTGTLTVQDTSAQLLQDSIFVRYVNGVELDRDTIPVSLGGGGGGASQLTDLSDVSSATATSGNVLLANGSTFASQAMSGDATINSSGVLDIASQAVENTEMALMATLTLKGNNTGGNSTPFDLTVSQVKTMLNINGGTYVEQGTAPTDTTLIWMSCDTTAGLCHVMQYFSPYSAWDTVGYYDRITGWYDDEPPIIGFGAGQSNMARGTLYVDPPKYPNIAHFEVTAWDTAGVTGSAIGVDNMLYGTAMEYARQGRIVRLIRVAEGSTSIALWAAAGYLRDSLNQKITRSGIGNWTKYGTFVEWMQGENNYTWTTGRYRDSLSSVISLFKDESWWPENGGYFVAGGLVEGVQDRQDKVLRTLNFDADPYTLYVPGYGAAVETDNLHYTAAGRLQMGERMFNALEGQNAMNAAPAIDTLTATSFDFKNQASKIIKSGATTGNLPVTISNPEEGGKYEFHFSAITDSVDLAFTGYVFADLKGDTASTLRILGKQSFPLYYQDSTFYLDQLADTLTSGVSLTNELFTSQITAPTLMTESPQYTFTGTGGGTFDKFALSDWYIPANTNGEIIHNLDQANSCGIIMGFNIQEENVAYNGANNGYEYAAHIDNPCNNVKKVSNGVSANPDTPTSYLNNGSERLRIRRSNDTLYLDYYNGTSYSVIHTFSTTYSGALYGAMTFQSSSKVVVDAPQNNVLSRGGGAAFTLRIPATSYENQIRDADNDTKIQVEESFDEDIIRFDVAGTEEAQITANGLGIGEAPTASFSLSVAEGIRSTGRISVRGAGNTLATTGSRIQFFNTTSSGEFNFLLDDSDNFELWGPLGSVEHTTASDGTVDYADNNVNNINTVDADTVLTEVVETTGLEIRSDNAGATTTHAIYNKSASPADDDKTELVFDLDDNGSNRTTFASIEGISSNVADGSELGTMEMNVTDAGTLKRRIQLGAADMTFGLTGDTVAIKNDGIVVNVTQTITATTSTKVSRSAIIYNVAAGGTATLDFSSFPNNGVVTIINIDDTDLTVSVSGASWTGSDPVLSQYNTVTAILHSGVLYQY